MIWTDLKSSYESPLFCLFLCSRSYPEKVEEFITTFYKIRYILRELYVAVTWIINQLIIYIDQMNAALVLCWIQNSKILTLCHACSSVLVRKCFHQETKPWILATSKHFYTPENEREFSVQNPTFAALGEKKNPQWGNMFFKDAFKF